MAFTIGGGFMEYFQIAPVAGDEARFASPLGTGAELPAL